MTEPTPASADPEAVAALKRRRRRRRWARIAAVIAFFLLPSALQIEPKFTGPRLETLRIDGPLGGGSGGAVRPAAKGVRLAAVTTGRPVPPFYGALREAPATDLELRSGVGPDRVVDLPAPTEAAISTAEPSFLPAAGPGAPTPFVFPASTSPFSPPAAFLVGPTSGTGTPPVIAPTTPVIPPGGTTPIATPPGTTSTTPTTPTPPATTPPGGATPPVVTPPADNPPGDTPPGGTTPITVVTPPSDPGVPDPVISEGPPPPGGGPGGGGPLGTPGGAPEPSLWFELIAGFGLAGLALRRRRLAAA